MKVFKENLQQDKLNRWAGSSWIAVLILCVLSWWTCMRIMSYATGQDPRIYIHLADQLRASGFSLSALAETADFVVPGYPLLIAGVWSVWGIFAAYWLNLPIFIVSSIPLLLIWRRYASGQNVNLLLVAGFGLVITGFPLNPHFLFLPFRGVIEWGFMFSCLALAGPALDHNRKLKHRLWSASGCAVLMMFGAVFRETVVFMAIPIGSLFFVRALRREKNAWKILGAFAAPLLLAFLAVLVWRLSCSSFLNDQARAWFRGMLRGGYAAPVQTLLASILANMGDQLRWYGLVFLAVGCLVGIVRRNVAVYVFMITAALLILFYAVYKSHPRYNLSAFGLLAFVAAYGFSETVGWLLGLIRANRVRLVIYFAVLAALIGWNGYAISKMETWGPRVSRQDLKRLQSLNISSNGMCFIGRDQRHLVDALLSFTDMDPLDPVLERTNIVRAAGSVYLLPLNKSGTFPIHSGVRATDWLLHYFDLRPSKTMIRMGDAVYQACRIEPWTNLSQTVELDVEDASAGGVVWMDFRSGVEEDVQLYISAAGKPLAEYVCMAPSGWQAVWVPPFEQKAHVLLHIESTAPLPGDLACSYAASGRTKWFRMEEGRSPSIADWLGAGFELRTTTDKHGASFLSNAVVNVPVPVGIEFPEMRVKTIIIPRPSSDKGADGMLGLCGSTQQTSWKLKAGRKITKPEWIGVVSAASGTLPVCLSVNRPDDIWYVRLENLGVSFQIRSQD